MAHRFVARASVGTPPGSPHDAPVASHAPGFFVPDVSGVARGVVVNTVFPLQHFEVSLDGQESFVGALVGVLVLQPKLVDLLAMTFPPLASSSCKACST